MAVGLGLPSDLIRAPRHVLQQARVVRQPRIGRRQQRVKSKLGREDARARRSKPTEVKVEEGAVLGVFAVGLSNLEDCSAVAPRRACLFHIHVLTGVDDNLLCDSHAREGGQKKERRCQGRESKSMGR